MDLNKINELLNRYWNCETSLEEEQQLRTYFSGKDIPDALKETAELFRYFEQSREQHLQDVSFEKKVLTHVNAPANGKVMKLVFNAMRIAAGVAVLITAGWFVRNEIRSTTPQEIVDTYDDPQLAFEETKKALLMISKSFGTAEQQAKKINLFNEAQQEIQKGKTEEVKL